MSGGYVEEWQLAQAKDRIRALEAELAFQKDLLAKYHAQNRGKTFVTDMETNCNQATEGTRSVRPLDVGPTPRGILPNSLGTSTKGDANGV